MYWWSAAAVLALLAKEGQANPAQLLERATTTTGCPADKCFSTISLRPSLASLASSFCSSYIKYTGTVYTTSTTTVTSKSTVTATTLQAATVVATVSSTTTPSPVTVTSVCGTITKVVPGTFTTSVGYNSLGNNNAQKKREASVQAAFFTSGCGSGAPFTSKISSACSCYLGKPKTVTSITTATTKPTVSVTSTPPATTVTVTAIVSGTTASVTSCTYVTATSIKGGGAAGQTCGVPVVAYTTGGIITCANTAAAPSATNARFRIEGNQAGEGTIFDGPCIASGPANITTPSGGTHLCDGTNNNANPAPGGTLTTQIDAAGRQNGFDFDGTYVSQYQDFFINRIDQTSQANNQYWGVLQSLAFTPSGGCESEIQPGEGLWAFDAFNANSFLALSSEYAVVHPGDTVQLTILQTDGNSANTSPAGGVSFAGATSDSNGLVSFTAPLLEGCYKFKGIRSGSIRSPAFYLTVASSL